jgi:hypothetical protein
MKPAQKAIMKVCEYHVQYQHTPSKRNKPHNRLKKNTLKMADLTDDTKIPNNIFKTIKCSQINSQRQYSENSKPLVRSICIDVKLT